MSVDAVQPTLGIPAVHPKQDANSKSDRESRRNGKPGEPDKEPQEQPDVFLNALGQLTGMTINITA